jgi:hypothetical protein
MIADGTGGVALGCNSTTLLGFTLVASGLLTDAAGCGGGELNAVCGLTGIVVATGGVGEAGRLSAGDGDGLGVIRGSLPPEDAPWLLGPGVAS